MWMGQPPEQVTLVFDGWCGFCTGSARLISRLDRHDRVEAMASQLESTLAATGVYRGRGCPRGLGRGTGWRSHERSVGHRGCGRRRARHPDPPAPVAPPGAARRARERVYARIADNRRRFRGDDPWCAQHPEHCSGAGAASCSIEQT